MTDTCPDCRAAVRPAVSYPALADILVDPEPAPDGTLQIRPRGPGLPPLAVALSPSRRFGKRDLYHNHTATCPKAGRQRTRARES